jgi:hypothetical protein
MAGDDVMRAARVIELAINLAPLLCPHTLSRSQAQRGHTAVCAANTRRTHAQWKRVLCFLLRMLHSLARVMATTRELLPCRCLARVRRWEEACFREARAPTRA